MLGSILFLCAVTVLGWAFFMYLLKPIARFSFTGTPLRTFLYFFALTFLVLFLFYSVTWRLFADTSVFALVFALAIVGFLNVWVYRFINQTYRHTLDALPTHPDLELIRMKPAFLFSKLGDVLFQQTVIGTLILMLVAMQVPFWGLTALCAGIFFLGHFGLFFRMPHEWALYFIVSALVGGAFFPFLILYLPGGLYYAVAFHMLWYVMTGAFYVAEHSRHAKKHRT